MLLLVRLWAAVLLLLLAIFSDGFLTIGVEVFEIGLSEGSLMVVRFLEVGGLLLVVLLLLLVLMLLYALIGRLSYSGELKKELSSPLLLSS